MIGVWSTQTLTPVEWDVVEAAWKRVFPTTPLTVTTAESANSLPTNVTSWLALQPANSISVTSSSPTKMIPSMSPAQLRTKPDSLTVLTTALRVAHRISSQDSTRTPNGNYRLAASRAEVIEYLQAPGVEEDPLGNALYLDIETQGSIHKLHHSERPLLCVGMKRFGDDEVFIIGRDLLGGAWPEFIQALQLWDLCAHNAKFDFGTLCMMLGTEPGALRPWFDTMLAHYALQPAGSGHRLEYLAGLYHGAQPWDVGGDKTNLATQAPEDLHTYNALDVGWGWQLLETFHPLVSADAHTRLLLYSVLMRASYLLQKREPHGIGFDYDYTRNELAETLEIEAERGRKKLVEMAHTVLPRTRTVYKPRSRTHKDPETGEKHRTAWKEPVEQPYEFNPGSWQQVLQLYKQAGKQLPGTDKKIMQARADDGDAFAAALLEWRTVTKQHSTYVISLLDKCSDVMGDTRVFPTYKLHGTVTGRLSSETPNVQNIPRLEKLRRMFKAFRRGRVLTQVDYSQAELRVIAAESGCAWLLDIFARPDADVFEQMLPNVFPKVDFTTISPAQRKELRAKLKGVIYGLLFGRQARAIAVAIGSTTAEASEIINRFFGNAPEVADWRGGVIRGVHTGTPLVTRTGRRFQHEVLTPKNADEVERSALSALPQGSASDMTLLAACELDERITAMGRDWHVVALVHDSITLDTPEDEAEEAKQLTAQIMQDTARQWFPETVFVTDGKSAYTWDQTS